MRTVKRTNKLIALFLLFSLIVTCFQGVVAEDLEGVETPSETESSVVTDIGDTGAGSEPEEVVGLGGQPEDGGGEEPGVVAGDTGEGEGEDDPESDPEEQPVEEGDPENGEEGGEKTEPVEGEVKENPDPEAVTPGEEGDEEPVDTEKAPEDEEEEEEEKEEKPEEAPVMLRAAPPTRANNIVNWSLNNYPDSDSSETYNYIQLYGRDATYITENDDVKAVFTFDVVPTRTDYYAFRVDDIVFMNISNPNTSGQTSYASSSNIVLADSNGETITSGYLISATAPLAYTEAAVLTAGQHYTLTVTFDRVISSYEQISDSRTLFKVRARTMHKYVNGRCVCFEDYPDDLYSHFGYRLATAHYGRPDLVYVYAEDAPEKRLEVRAIENVYIDGYLATSLDTTGNHLRNDNYYNYVPYFTEYNNWNSVNTYIPNANSGTYVEITMWSHDKTLAPIRFKLFMDPDTYELKTEVTGGKGSVQTLVAPTGVFEWDNQPTGYPYPADDLYVFWNGSELTAGLETSMYNNYGYEQYWTENPAPFSAPIVRRADDGTYEVALVSEGELRYVPYRTGDLYYNNHYFGALPMMYYALGVSLEKIEAGDPWGGVIGNPLEIETFDVELSDYTEDTATVTVTGKLNRDLINREADEENLVNAYAEALSLSVGDKITKIYESDVESDGSFTITLEDATLDANIVLKTQGGSPASAQGNSGGTAPGDNEQRPTLRRFITADSESGSGLIGYKRVPILRVDGDTEEEPEYAYGYADMGYETLYVPLLQMPLSKVWTDSEGKTSNAITARHKDDVVVVDVLADGEVVRTVELTSKTDPAWELVVKGLPEYTHYERGADPETITYTAKEKEIKGYHTQYDEEATSKYLILGEEITDTIFEGKYILLSESAKMALSVKDGEVVVVPFDPDDEYQKWTTEEHTYKNAFNYNGTSEDMGVMLSDYTAVIIRNDATGKYLGITTAGPILIADSEIDNNGAVATYNRSPGRGFAIIRTAGRYIAEQNRFVKYSDMGFQYYYENIDPNQVMIVSPNTTVSVPQQWGYDDDWNWVPISYWLWTPPWPYLALKWYDAKVGTAFVASLTSSSTLADVNVYDESDGILYKVTNTPNTLVIEKSLEFEQSGQAKTVKEEVFYVTLFTDSGRTERAKGIDVQKISIVNGSSGKVLIEGIPSGTYYIGETDANGVLLEDGELSDGTSFVPQFDTTEIEIPEDGTEGVTFTFKNVITDPPKTADIVVNKQLVDQETGKDVMLDGKYTIFVALFSDADHLVRVSEIKEMVIDGTSSGTVTFEDVDEGIYYISETDANGTAISTGTIGSSTEYKAKYEEGEKVTVTGENEAEEITFKNVFAPEKPPVSPKAPSTGDPSVNYLNTYVVLALLSLAVIINVIVRIKKKS